LASSRQYARCSSMPSSTVPSPSASRTSPLAASCGHPLPLRHTQRRWSCPAPVPGRRQSYHPRRRCPSRFVWAQPDLGDDQPEIPAGLALVLLFPSAPRSVNLQATSEGRRIRFIHRESGELLAAVQECPGDPQCVHVSVDPGCRTTSRSSLPSTHGARLLPRAPARSTFSGAGSAYLIYSSNHYYLMG
jgi:hypothetical protein